MKIVIYRNMDARGGITAMSECDEHYFSIRARNGDIWTMEGLRLLKSGASDPEDPTVINGVRFCSITRNFATYLLFSHDC